MLMDFSKLSIIFTVMAITVVYIIIFTALRIMNKDVKNSGKKKVVKRSLGLEVIEPGGNTNLKRGSIIPLRRYLTIGRKEDNIMVLTDGYASGHHARIYLKNNKYILEDLKSTNGTMVNSTKVSNKVYLKIGDEIKIGTSVFKVIG